MLQRTILVLTYALSILLKGRKDDLRCTFCASNILPFCLMYHNLMNVEASVRTFSTLNAVAISVILELNIALLLTTAIIFIQSCLRSAASIPASLRSLKVLRM